MYITKSKFLLASIKLLTTGIPKIFHQPSPPPWPYYSGDFDPENAYRKPPVILKIVPEAGFDMCTWKSTSVKLALRDDYWVLKIYILAWFFIKHEVPEILSRKSELSFPSQFKPLKIIYSLDNFGWSYREFWELHVN